MQRIYEQLAERYERQQEPRQRDNMLVLAADDAHNAGDTAEAERLRRRLLEWNPHHLLRPFASFAEALQSPDIRELLADLRRQYPPEYVDRQLGKAPSEAHGKAGAAAESVPEHRDSATLAEALGNGPRLTAAPPRRREPRESKPPSPYERFDPPPAARAPQAWNAAVAQTLFVLALLLAGALAVYIFGRPFLP